MANVIVGRKSGFIQRSGRMRRETIWIGIVETNTVLAAASNVVLFGGLSAGGLALRPFTVVRTRLLLNVKSDQRAVSENYSAALGISVVTEQAQAAGVGSVPTPYAELDSDVFFFWEQVAGQISVTSDIGVLEAGHSRYGDSKAMRKVEDGQDLATTIEASAVSNGVTVFKAGRLLAKLH